MFASFLLVLSLSGPPALASCDAPEEIGEELRSGFRASAESTFPTSLAEGLVDEVAKRESLDLTSHRDFAVKWWREALSSDMDRVLDALESRFYKAFQASAACRRIVALERSPDQELLAKEPESLSESERQRAARLQQEMSAIAAEIGALVKSLSSDLTTLAVETIGQERLVALGQDFKRAVQARAKKDPPR